jgi:hypothetical protein
MWLSPDFSPALTAQIDPSACRWRVKGSLSFHIPQMPQHRKHSLLERIGEQLAASLFETRGSKC